jgi:hypothetical protein
MHPSSVDIFHATQQRHQASLLLLALRVVSDGP